MLRIGYIRLSDGDQDGAAQDDNVAILRALGCHVVRVEEDNDLPTVLASILEFIGQGDQLVAPNLSHLGGSARGVLELVERLDQRGAVLVTAEPALSSAGPEGETLRAALAAVAALEPIEPPRRRTRAPTHEIRALQRAGMGPVEIARRLGVSRMTVWRKLKQLSAEPCGAA
jgi:DNA invertase Pin-like site-specific DNA recombinase